MSIKAIRESDTIVLVFFIMGMSSLFHLITSEDMSLMEERNSVIDFLWLTVKKHMPTAFLFSRKFSLIYF